MRRFFMGTALIGVVACGGGGSKSAPVPTPAGPVISGFTASPTSIAYGGSATLVATFSGGSGSIDYGIGGVVSGVGISTGPLTATTIYTLTVGAATATTTVIVAPAPPPATPSTDLVQASGTAQSAGGLRNRAVVGELIPAQSANGGAEQVRHGFDPR